MAGIENSPQLEQFLEQEKQRAMVSEMITKLTNVCWDKCITGTPGSKFSSSESSCLTNCAQRYMDMSMIIMKRFQSMHLNEKQFILPSFIERDSQRRAVLAFCLWLKDPLISC